MKAEDFGKDFIWGVSTSAYQIEGAHDRDGKGPSIWDVFSNTKRKIQDNHNGNHAADFYYRFEADILLLKSLNIKHFRFSISWSRLLPNGIGIVNPEGILFYHKIIDCCLEHGITPWVTLYHWDLPNELEKKGGWANRAILQWFKEYVNVCVEHFGSKIKNWMILNEPIVFTGAGYFLGIHAPGRTGLKNFLPALHHASLCQNIGFYTIKERFPESEVGSTFSFSHIDAYDQTPLHTQAARRVDAIVNRMALEPTLGLFYPTEDLKLLNSINKYVNKGDLELLKTPFDFIGVQVYTREIVKHSYFMPYVRAKLVSAEKRNVGRTVMNWEIYPEALSNIIKKVSQYSGVKKIIVTENGAAFNDKQVGDKIHDTERVQYLEKYIHQLKEVKDQGINVAGYFVWSFIDNFEWAEGYHPRFGIVYVNFKTQERIIKNSGYWYKNFIGNHDLSKSNSKIYTEEEFALPK